MGKDDFCKHSDFQTDNKHKCMRQVNNCRKICIKVGKGKNFYVDDPTERKLASQFTPYHVYKMRSRDF